MKTYTSQKTQKVYSVICIKEDETYPNTLVENTIYISCKESSFKINGIISKEFYDSETSDILNLCCK